MNWLKQRITSLIPESVLLQYHKYMAKYAARKFKYPSNKLIVIGVTGTKGKSTTSNLIWHMLTKAGYTVGMATTVNFRIGNKHWLNDTKMTMLGRTQLQQLLSDMVEAGCQYAVVETSSEGIKQFRHLGINYDIGVFTNLHEEHLDAHGGFENYKQAKLELFRHLSKSEVKIDNGSTIQKAAVINADATAADEFIAAAKVGQHVIWTQHNAKSLAVNLIVGRTEETGDGLEFELGDYTFKSPLKGEWNAENIISALGVAITQGMSYPDMVQALKSFKSVPGRMEIVDVGQDFTVVVDYAYEPKSLALLYGFWKKKLGEGNKMITLISSTGGGRDVWRRPINGKTAAEYCDYVIATDEDPYDDDPQQIIDEVADGALQAGMKEGENFWRILNRAEAIRKAVELAKPGDIVFLTAKGAEQKMCVAKGKKIQWDDRAFVRDAIKELLSKKG